jgi:chemotaxis protein MotB
MREESPFASNRHLSAVRASNVVDHLAAAGLPAERMVAAAFGDTRPLAPGTDEATRDRNRRIELRFVTR